jgi:hypothetical protein
MVALVKSMSVICAVQLLFGHPACAAVGWAGGSGDDALILRPEPSHALAESLPLLNGEPPPGADVSRPILCRATPHR